MVPAASPEGALSSTWYCAAGSATGVTAGDTAGFAEQSVIVSNASSEASTGVYRAASGEFNIAILGVLRSTLSASGLTINGAGTFTGGVSGGTY
jgi:uncharacterized protein YgiB involved in biofilm formation